MRRTVVATILSLIAASSATAQPNPSPELVPKTLVEALLGRNTSVTIGALPPTVESKVVLPAGSKILGGSTNPNQATGIVILDGAVNTVAERFQGDLLKSGWEVMDQAPMQFYGADFIDPPADQRRPMAATNETYCGRAGTLTVRYEPEGFSQTRLFITSTGTNRCAQMRDMMLQSRPEGMPARPKRPILVNPGAARSQPAVCQSSNYASSWGGSGAQLASTMPASEILAHYAKQLADSGWKSSSAIATGTWTRPDSTGAIMEYEISVRAPDDAPNCRRVESQLRLRRGR